MDDLFSYAESEKAPEAAEPQALSVSAAMQLAKGALEGVTVKLVGEVSELNNKVGYKAVYFTVKDEKSALPCMMWLNRYKAAGVQMFVGQLVELTGRFTLYAAKGRMNFDVFSVAAAGEGNLRLQVANLARKLQAEGLMDPARKQPIPEFPQTIGVVTSPRGDAVHDVLRTLRRRFPVARVLLAGVPVEGKTAAAGIVEGMRCVAHAGAEVILVVRGGGSYEDLMPFNDEFLARMIAKCPVPVVTGIGHEPDTSIADMVADRRASTPTAAAEAVSPSRERMDALFDGRGRALKSSVQRVLDANRARVERCAAQPVMREPNLLFANEAQTLDYLNERLNAAMPYYMERNQQQLAALMQQLCVLGPHLTERFGREVRVAAAQLDALSPLAVLGRGYAIARGEDGAVVKTLDDVQVGAPLNVQVNDGVINCTVDSLERVGASVTSWKE